ncbi:MAG: helix-turn-helix transcriptional regulator [Rubrobacteraceae bacterium]|nr:helix-turn-helix transcriptional regulator [Rubrobacteraceae bacterium]
MLRSAAKTDNERSNRYADTKEPPFRAGLSVSDLAKRSGLSRAAVWQLERGKNGPTLHTMEKLARGLGCEVTDLLGEEDMTKR